MAAFVGERNVRFEEQKVQSGKKKAASSSCKKIPLLRDLSKNRLKGWDLTSPHPQQGTPRAQPINLTPCFEVVRVVDGCSRKTIHDGEYHRNTKFQKPNQSQSSTEVSSRSKLVKKDEVILERKRRVAKLCDLGIPLDERDVERLVTSVANNEKELCEQPDTSYPALFEISLRVKRCFIEVHSREEILFIVMDPSNKDAVIGAGAFKKVYKAFHIKQPQILAYAVSRLDHSPRSEKRAAEREEKYLSLFKDSGAAVDLRKAFYYQREQQVLIMKLYTQTMFEVLNAPLERTSFRGIYYSDRQKLVYAINIVQAIAHVNSKGVLHRDVKPENLLVNGLNVVLTDFGLACEMTDTKALKEGSGAMPYMSYNILKFLESNVEWKNEVEGDVWAAGCVLWVLFSERLYSWFNDLNPSVSTQQNLKRATKKILALSRKKPKSDQRVYNIVWNMFQPDPKLRISAVSATKELRTELARLPQGNTYKIHTQFPVFCPKKRSTGTRLPTIFSLS